MKKLLVVDDSSTVLSNLKLEIAKYSDIEPYFATTYKETVHLLREHKGKFHAALLDLNLPDAPKGEVILLANSHHIPTVVLTGTLDEKRQNFILKKDIVDVILKSDQASIKFAVTAITRTLKNYDLTILVVDDSALYRKSLRNTLEKINLNVIEAQDGKEALKILKEKEYNISLVLTDYEMPNMNGLELVFEIRKIYNKDQLGIIAISSIDAQDIISKFLKFGANDYINKPFTHNEIVTRVNSNLELLDLFKQIQDMANKDYLTGAYNRRYFFDSGEAIYAKAKRKNKPLVIAMIDIDKFKNINDAYGHDIGDIAIKEVCSVLHKDLRASDLMARFGGEEFCVLLEDITLDNTMLLFEKIRNSFEKNVIHTTEITLSYTVSIGIYFGLSHSLEDMIKLSDEALYIAKESGRNRVEIKSS